MAYERIFLTFLNGGGKWIRLFFYADYYDKKAYIGDVIYSAGIFAVRLLNQYYKSYAAACISVFKANNLTVQQELEQGYINPSNFVNCNEEIQSILKTPSSLQPFSLITVRVYYEG